MSPSPHPCDDPQAGPGVVRRVLVVDDSLAQRRALARMLERRGYEVLEAACGTDALALLDRNSVDMVISDWMMPGLSGPDLVAALRRRPEGESLYVVLLTAKHGEDEIAQGLGAGADDFLVKPVSGTELHARIRAAERMLGMQRRLSASNADLSRTLGELRGLYGALERDMLEARALQRSLIRPRHAEIGPAAIALDMQACGHVGGDLVGFFRVSERELGLYALDVSGHGMGSALMTARLAGTLSGSDATRNVAVGVGPDGQPVARDPAAVVAEMNRAILGELATELYLTICLCVLDLATGRLRLVQAGHPHPLVLSPDGDIRALGSGGPPVGLLAGMSYVTCEDRLRPGDRLILMSDGITEAQRGDGTVFEDAALGAALRASGTAPVRAAVPALLAALAVFTGRARQEDDVSVLMLDYAPGGRAA
jgi:sigma-B regulation protein RsbU (phosphoserine phosphatase)